MPGLTWRHSQDSEHHHRNRERRQVDDRKTCNRVRPGNHQPDRNRRQSRVESRAATASRPDESTTDLSESAIMKSGTKNAMPTTDHPQPSCELVANHQDHQHVRSRHHLPEAVDAAELIVGEPVQLVDRHVPHLGQDRIAAAEREHGEQRKNQKQVQQAGWM